MKKLIEQIETEVEQPIRVALQRLEVIASDNNKDLSLKQVNQFGRTDGNLRWWLYCELPELKKVLAPGTVGGSKKLLKRS